MTDDANKDMSKAEWALFVILFIPSMLWKLFVAQILWGWFVVPEGMPRLSLGALWGLGLCVGVMRMHSFKKESEYSALKSVLMEATAALLALVMGWIVLWGIGLL